MYKPGMPRLAELPTRDRLLAAGQALARRQGLRALTVRAVAARAEVNLGSFVYHFGNRERFIGELIEGWYAPLFSQLQLDADAGASPLAALRAALLHLVDWLAGHRAFVAQLLLDAAAGERAAQRFLRTLDTRHPALLHTLVQRAQAAGALQPGDAWHQLMFVMSTLALPLLLLQVAGTRPAAPSALLQTLGALAADPQAVRQRLDWALAGLAPRKEMSA